MPDLDILYVSFNRLEFTVQTMTALARYTDWTEVSKLYVKDDGSKDGTLQWLEENVPLLAEQHGFDYVVDGSRLGGPVAATNWYLDQNTGAPVFAKIDNDMVVCPGWLGEMIRQMELHPTVDILGMEPFLGDPAMPGTVHRDIEPCEHIGGKGLLRTRAFVEYGRPTPGGLNGYFGFTQFQTANPEIVKAWIKPDLPVFGLDQMRPEHGRWRALAETYARLGWQRLWPVYGSEEHYAWWEPV